MVTYLIWNQTIIGSNPIVPNKSVAQRLERLAVNQKVVGSNPTRFEFFFGIVLRVAHWVHIPGEEVRILLPVLRNINNKNII